VAAEVPQAFPQALKFHNISYAITWLVDEDDPPVKNPA
jgi:hypothetical protein